MMPSIQFLGAAGTVTGSKYLVKCDGLNILVDCGLFQGLKSLRLQNWDQFPVEPSEVDVILLTHAHIDHSGYIPRLVKSGFKGKIYATSATLDLCQILLPDAGYLAEEEADFLNRHHRSKHRPALPLFTFEEAKQALRSFESVPFNQVKSLTEKIHFHFRYAGHILGAASVSLEIGEKKIFFTGDIGRASHPLFFDPQPIPDADYIVTESTYGNRRHGSEDVLADLEKIIDETYERKGVVILPSFAVGRAQELMYYLWQLKKRNRLPNIPMYLNSPMATNVNNLFIKHHLLHRLTRSESEELCNVVEYVRSVEESKKLNEREGPMLIISASGMLTGGRVLHHIKKFGPDSKNTIVLAGFQAAGTRGEALENHIGEIKIHGEIVPIRARIKALQNMSGHADYQEILDWFSGSNIKSQKSFITHGEPAAAEALSSRISERLGWSCLIPVQNQIIEL
jgi:metallo-beta-lactamase family protein